jgi:hypothetical protein
MQRNWQRTRERSEIMELNVMRDLKAHFTRILNSLGDDEPAKKYAELTPHTQKILNLIFGEDGRGTGMLRELMGQGFKDAELEVGGNKIPIRFHVGRIGNEEIHPTEVFAGEPFDKFVAALGRRMGIPNVFGVKRRDILDEHDHYLNFTLSGVNEDGSDKWKSLASIVVPGEPESAIPLIEKLRVGKKLNNLEKVLASALLPPKGWTSKEQVVGILAPALALVNSEIEKEEKRAFRVESGKEVSRLEKELNFDLKTNVKFDELFGQPDWKEKLQDIVAAKKGEIEAERRLEDEERGRRDAFTKELNEKLNEIRARGGVDLLEHAPSLSKKLYGKSDWQQRLENALNDLCGFIHTGICEKLGLEPEKEDRNQSLRFWAKNIPELADAVLSAKKIELSEAGRALIVLAKFGQQRPVEMGTLIRRMRGMRKEDEISEVMKKDLSLRLQPLIVGGLLRLESNHVIMTENGEKMAHGGILRSQPRDVFKADHRFTEMLSERL